MRDVTFESAGLVWPVSLVWPGVTGEVMLDDFGHEISAIWVSPDSGDVMFDDFVTVYPGTAPQSLCGHPYCRDLM